MSELGQILKQARKEKNISLEEIQESTKIRKRYLEAIEEGNYKVLPGNFYVRAFIKSYAEHVGLDPEELFRMYAREIPASQPEAPAEHTISRKQRTNNAERFSKLTSMILVWSFSLLIIGVIYYYVNQSYDTPEKNTADNNTRIDSVKQQEGGAVEELPEDKEEQPEEESAEKPAEPVKEAVVKLEKSQGALDYYTVTGADKLNLSIEVTGTKCWFEIRQGNKSGSQIDTGTLKQGESRSWSLEHSVYINVGRGNEVNININGTAFQPGNKASSKKLQVDLVRGQ